MLIEQHPEILRSNEECRDDWWWMERCVRARVCVCENEKSNEFSGCWIFLAWQTFFYGDMCVRTNYDVNVDVASWLRQVNFLQWVFFSLQLTLEAKVVLSIRAKLFAKTIAHNSVLCYDIIFLKTYSTNWGFSLCALYLGFSENEYGILHPYTRKDESLNRLTFQS